MITNISNEHIDNLITEINQVRTESAKHRDNYAKCMSEGNLDMADKVMHKLMKCESFINGINTALSILGYDVMYYDYDESDGLHKAYAIYSR